MDWVCKAKIKSVVLEKVPLKFIATLWYIQTIRELTEGKLNDFQIKFMSKTNLLLEALLKETKPIV